MTKYDYEALYDEFYRDKAKTGMTQYAFAESKGIHPKQLCRGVWASSVKSKCRLLSTRTRVCC